MEVWERENNAKEALGVNVSSPEEAAADHGDAEDDEGGAVHPRDDASVSPTSRDSPIVVASITPVDDRLAALKRSVESKVGWGWAGVLRSVPAARVCAHKIFTLSR